MKKFILLHRAVDNSPVIINTEFIITCFKDTDNDNETTLYLAQNDDCNEATVVGVNESVERVYNIITGMYSPAKNKNNTKENNKEDIA